MLPRTQACICDSLPPHVSGHVRGQIRVSAQPLIFTNGTCARGWKARLKWWGETGAGSLLDLPSSKNSATCDCIYPIRAPEPAFRSYLSDMDSIQLKVLNRRGVAVGAGSLKIDPKDMCFQGTVPITTRNSQSLRVGRLYITVSVTFAERESIHTLADQAPKHIPCEEAPEDTMDSFQLHEALVSMDHTNRLPEWPSSELNQPGPYMCAESIGKEITAGTIGALQNEAAHAKHDFGHSEATHHTHVEVQAKFERKLVFQQPDVLPVVSDENINPVHLEEQLAGLLRRAQAVSEDLGRPKRPATAFHVPSMLLSDYIPPLKSEGLAATVDLLVDGISDALPDLESVDDKMVQALLNEAGPAPSDLSFPTLHALNRERLDFLKIVRYFRITFTRLNIYSSLCGIRRGCWLVVYPPPACDSPPSDTVYRIRLCEIRRALSRRKTCPKQNCFVGIADLNQEVLMPCVFEDDHLVAEWLTSSLHVELWGPSEAAKEAAADHPSVWETVELKELENIRRGQGLVRLAHTMIPLASMLTASTTQAFATVDLQGDEHTQKIISARRTTLQQVDTRRIVLSHTSHIIGTLSLLVSLVASSGACADTSAPRNRISTAMHPTSILKSRIDNPPVTESALFPSTKWAIVHLSHISRTTVTHTVQIRCIAGKNLKNSFIWEISSDTLYNSLPLSTVVEVCQSFRPPVIVEIWKNDREQMTQLKAGSELQLIGIVKVPTVRADMNALHFAEKSNIVNPLTGEVRGSVQIGAIMTNSKAEAETMLQALQAVRESHSVDSPDQEQLEYVVYPERTDESKNATKITETRETIKFAAAASDYDASKERASFADGASMEQVVSWSDAQTHSAVESLKLDAFEAADWQYDDPTFDSSEERQSGKLNSIHKLRDAVDSTAAAIDVLETNTITRHSTGRFLIDVSAQGTYQPLLEDLAAPLGCYVCYNFRSKSESRLSAQMSPEGLPSSLPDHLWWDADTAVMNTSVRHIIEGNDENLTDVIRQRAPLQFELWAHESTSGMRMLGAAELSEQALKITLEASEFVAKLEICACAPQNTGSMAPGVPRFLCQLNLTFSLRFEPPIVKLLHRPMSSYQRVLDVHLKESTSHQDPSEPASAGSSEASESLETSIEADAVVVMNDTCAENVDDFGTATMVGELKPAQENAQNQQQSGESPHLPSPLQDKFCAEVRAPVSPQRTAQTSVEGESEDSMDRADCYELAPLAESFEEFLYVRIECAKHLELDGTMQSGLVGVRVTLGGTEDREMSRELPAFSTCFVAHAESVSWGEECALPARNYSTTWTRSANSTSQILRCTLWIRLEDEYSWGQINKEIPSIGDSLVGTAVIDLSPMTALGNICGWYHIYDSYQQCRGQINVSATLRTPTSCQGYETEVKEEARNDDGEDSASLAPFIADASSAEQSPRQTNLAAEETHGWNDIQQLLRTLDDMNSALLRRFDGNVRPQKEDEAFLLTICEPMEDRDGLKPSAACQGVSEASIVCQQEPQAHVDETEYDDCSEAPHELHRLQTFNDMQQGKSERMATYESPRYADHAKLDSKPDSKHTYYKQPVDRVFWMTATTSDATDAGTDEIKPGDATVTRAERVFWMTAANFSDAGEDDVNACSGSSSGDLNLQDVSGDYINFDDRFGGDFNDGDSEAYTEYDHVPSDHADGRVEKSPQNILSHSAFNRPGDFNGRADAVENDTNDHIGTELDDDYNDGGEHYVRDGILAEEHGPGEVDLAQEEGNRLEQEDNRQIGRKTCHLEYGVTNSGRDNDVIQDDTTPASLRCATGSGESVLALIPYPVAGHEAASNDLLVGVADLIQHAEVKRAGQCAVVPLDDATPLAALPCPKQTGLELLRRIAQFYAEGASRHLQGSLDTESFSAFASLPVPQSLTFHHSDFVCTQASCAEDFPMGTSKPDEFKEQSTCMPLDPSSGPTPLAPSEHDDIHDDSTSCICGSEALCNEHPVQEQCKDEVYHEGYDAFLAEHDDDERESNTEEQALHAFSDTDVPQIVPNASEASVACYQVRSERAEEPREVLSRGCKLDYERIRSIVEAEVQQALASIQPEFRLQSAEDEHDSLLGYFEKKAAPAFQRQFSERLRETQAPSISATSFQSPLSVGTDITTRRRRFVDAETERISRIMMKTAQRLRVTPGDER